MAKKKQARGDEPHSVNLTDLDFVKLHKLRCDECGDYEAISGERRTADQAAKSFTNRGWRVVNIDSNERYAYCPACAKECIE